jgi:Lrp/AsnC family leucine-responsive transcriptional regulator
MARPRGHRLDKLDLAILREMESGKKLSLKKLAEKTGLAYSPCRRRVQNLTKLKLIMLKGIVADAQSTWSVIRWVKITIRPNSGSAIDKFIDGITAIPNVIFCDIVTGDCDAFVRVAAPSAAEYEKVRQRIVDIIPGLYSQTVEVVRTAKGYRLPPEALFDLTDE